MPRQRKTARRKRQRYWHMPPLHTPLSQTFPHPPQLVASVIGSVHVPAQAMSDAAQPHAPPFVVELQAVPVPLHMPQAAPAAPQVEASCIVKGTQVFWLQHPFGHEAALQVHCPPTHELLAHLVPHMPQLFASVWTLTHALELPLPQSIGADAGHMHAPMLQLAESGQARVQLPQLLLSVLSETSHPLAATLSQSSKPGLHEEI
jgi:hypothetical protein